MENFDMLLFYLFTYSLILLMIKKFLILDAEHLYNQTPSNGSCRVYIKYCVFFLKMFDFSSASTAAALVFYLPFSGPSIPYTPKENREKPKSGIYFKMIEKWTPCSSVVMSSILTSQHLNDRPLPSFTLPPHTLVLGLLSHHQPRVYGEIQKGRPD